MPPALAIAAGTALDALQALPPGPPPGLAEFGYTLPAPRLHLLAAASTSSPAVASWVEQCGVFSVLESPPMPYMMLIVEPLEQRAERGEAEGRAVYQRMLDYTADLQKRGVLMNSSSLAHPREGLRLQLRDGRRSVVDGPFAESKEMVGGFFLVNVATQAEALALAAECPAAEWATIELRATGPCYESA